MQYWKPSEKLSVGDAMPFWWQDTFHLYYLVDEEHHARFHGLGGHIWAHASSTDLVHWQPHPLAVPLGDTGACDQYGICTGSVFHHEGIFYAFYATRTLDSGALSDPARQVTERVCVSTSRDGIHFTKSSRNPILSPPPGYHPRHFRDPFVLRDPRTGLFHMLVTACLDPAPLPGRGGCLAHFLSPDLARWEQEEPFLVPGLGSIPECPDYFHWNGWYYLTFLHNGRAHYRMAREPFGPWLCPPVETLSGPGVNAMKTAAFGSDRRIGVGFLAARREARDDAPTVYAGNAVFRELFQHPDGTLGARFPAEMRPASGPAQAPTFTALTPGVHVQENGGAHLCLPSGFAVAETRGVPAEGRVTFRVMPQGAAGHFGICVRGAGAYEGGYELRFSPAERRVRLGRLGKTAHVVEELGVSGLDAPFTVELFLAGDILDVCVDNRRCLIGRFPELHGDRLFLFAESTEVRFEEVRVAPLTGA